MTSMMKGKISCFDGLKVVKLSFMLIPNCALLGLICDPAMAARSHGFE